LIVVNCEYFCQKASLNGNQSPKNSKGKMYYNNDHKFTMSQLTVKINVYVLFLILKSILDPKSDFVAAFLVHPGKTYSNNRNGERNSIQQMNIYANSPASSLSINGDTATNVENINSNNPPRDSDVTNNLTAFSFLASLAATCILESEMKKDALRADGSQTPSSAANWIDDRSAYAVQSALDQIELKVVMFPPIIWFIYLFTCVFLLTEIIHFFLPTTPYS
jgi:hypothetical protein